jgi:hypothetical protein
VIQTIINLPRLLQLRMAVARFGEMDRAKWWNTKGLLAGLGEMALSRGFPKSHSLSRSRVVFGVAEHRCREVFDPPQCITFWKLSASVEDQFNNAWAEWLDNATEWTDFIAQLNEYNNSDLLDVLTSLQLINKDIVEQAKRLKRATDGCSVLLPGEREVTDDTIALLAAGFHRSEPGKLAVPYARLCEGEA